MFVLMVLVGMGCDNVDISLWTNSIQNIIQNHLKNERHLNKKRSENYMYVYICIV